MIEAEHVEFKCAYCGGMVRLGDSHANSIEKKNLKDKTTIVVRCIIVRTFEITLAEVK